MPRVTKPLTDTQIRQAKPKIKEYTLGDGQNLCLRVKPNGSRSWIFSYYRPTNGKRANISLGQYPAVSLAQARKLRQEQQVLLAENLDPGLFRAEKKRKSVEAHALTLNHISENWLQIKRSKVSKGYAEDIESSLKRYIYPNLGTFPVHLIDAQTVIRELKPIAAKGALETVKRLCQRLNEIMEFALISGFITSNPIQGVSKAFQPPRRKHLPSLKPSELNELLSRLSTANIKISTRLLILWQLHTMTRPAEAAGSRWEELDLKKALWTIPAERMKRRKPHTIPLTPQALSILEQMQPISGHREHIFPGDRNPRTHTNSQTANMALKRMGFASRLVAHGLRSIASTTLNEQAFDADLVETALAHTDRNEVRAAYNRAEYLKRRREMMCWWSNHIQTAEIDSIKSKVRDHL